MEGTARVRCGGRAVARDKLVGESGGKERRGRNLGRAQFGGSVVPGARGAQWRRGRRDDEDLAAVVDGEVVGSSSPLSAIHEAAPTANTNTSVTPTQVEVAI